MFSGTRCCSPTSPKDSISLCRSMPLEALLYFFQCLTHYCWTTKCCMTLTSEWFVSFLHIHCKYLLRTYNDRFQLIHSTVHKTEALKCAEALCHILIPSKCSLTSFIQASEPSQWSEATWTWKSKVTEGLSPIAVTCAVCMHTSSAAETSALHVLAMSA